MVNENNISTSSDITNTSVSSYTNLLTSTGNYTILDKWYLGEKAKDKLKNDLFFALEGHEYKVKIEHADIVIDGINKKGYHLIVTNNVYTWSPTWYSTPTSQKMEITC